MKERNKGEREIGTTTLKAGVLVRLARASVDEDFHVGKLGEKKEKEKVALGKRRLSKKNDKKTHRENKKWKLTLFYHVSVLRKHPARNGIERKLK